MEGKAKGGEKGEREREKECIPENLGLRRETFSFRCGRHKIRSQNVLLEESGTTPCMRTGGGWGLGRNARRRMNVCGLTYSGNDLTIWIRGMGTVKSVMRDIWGSWENVICLISGEMCRTPRLVGLVFERLFFLFSPSFGILSMERRAWMSFRVGARVRPGSGRCSVFASRLTIHTCIAFLALPRKPKIIFPFSFLLLFFMQCGCTFLHMRSTHM